MNINVGTPNSVPAYHKMTVEDYNRMTSIRTQPDLERRRPGQEQIALQIQQQEGRCALSVKGTTVDHDAGQEKPVCDIGPLSTTASSSPHVRANSHPSSWPEVRRLSGNFNSPTDVEMERHAKSPRSLRMTIKGWVKKSPPSTVL